MSLLLCERFSVKKHRTVWLHSQRGNECLNEVRVNNTCNRICLLTPHLEYQLGILTAHPYCNTVWHECRSQFCTLENASGLRTKTSNVVQKVIRILEIRWAPFRGATFPAKDGRVQDCKLLRSHRSSTGLTHLPFLACQVIQCPGQSRPESLCIASLPERASFPHDAGVRQHRILTRSFRSARIKRNAFGKGRTLAMLASKTDYVKVTSGMNIEEQQETSSPIQSSSVHSSTHKNLPQNL